MGWDQLIVVYFHVVHQQEDFVVNVQVVVIVVVKDVYLHGRHSEGKFIRNF